MQVKKKCTKMRQELGVKSNCRKAAAKCNTNSRNTHDRGGSNSRRQCRADEALHEHV